MYNVTLMQCKSNT